MKDVRPSPSRGWEIGFRDIVGVQVFAVKVQSV
jgi:hypothetical protein